MPYFLEILQFLSQDVAVPPIYSGWVNKVFNGSMALIFRTAHLSSDKILASLLSLPLEVWHDDGLSPTHLPNGLDGILSVNWLYHIPGATLSDFLARYRNALKIGGYLVCDMVTRQYDKISGNQWHTKDRKLPEEKRRPSEYTLRLDASEVSCIACRNGFAMIKSTCFTLSRPQRGSVFTQACGITEENKKADLLASPPFYFLPVTKKNLR